MRNVWLVIKHEVGTMLRQRSFWIMTFIMPALILAFQIYYVIQDNDLDAKEEKNAAETAEDTPAEAPPVPLIGLVDEAGFITEIPAGIPENMFVSYPDADAARAALKAGEIDQYVRIPADYVATGDVTVYDQNFQVLSGGDNTSIAFRGSYEWTLKHLINANLVGDENLATTLLNPVPSVYVKWHALNPPPATDQSDQNDQALAQVVSVAIPFLFYFILLVGTGYLMRSVVAEKENRTAEVLLLSLDSRQLMVGKILGLSAVTLVQLGIWAAGGILILGRGADLLNVANFSFPPGFLVWAVLFLMLGFLLYASIMAAAGALAPTAREGGQVTWLLVVPLMPTLMFSSAFFEEPHGTVSLVLSLFPFSAPSAMVTRMAVANVPLWQPIISLLGLAGVTYLMVTLAGRFFRADNLLSLASFSWRRLVTG